MLVHGCALGDGAARAVAAECRARSVGSLCLWLLRQGEDTVPLPEKLRACVDAATAGGGARAPLFIKTYADTDRKKLLAELERRPDCVCCVVVPSSLAAAVVELKEGDKVEVNYKNEGKWFKGKVAAIRSDGKYNIKYEDGEYAYRVERAQIRLQGADKKKKKDGAPPAPPGAGAPPGGAGAAGDAGDDTDGIGFARKVRAVADAKGLCRSARAAGGRATLGIVVYGDKTLREDEAARERCAAAGARVATSLDGVLAALRGGRGDGAGGGAGGVDGDGAGGADGRGNSGATDVTDATDGAGDDYGGDAAAAWEAGVRKRAAETPASGHVPSGSNNWSVGLERIMQAQRQSVELARRLRQLGNI